MVAHGACRAINADWGSFWLWGISLDKEVIAEVRSRANILEIVSEHVTMERSGVNYSGLCPFHDEKGASFSVRPDKGFFYCFGCHESGDVFAFVMKKQSLDFVDAVRHLARKYNIDLGEID